jgi:hypothetical protein
MTHAALSPEIGREFDPFLFASVGEDRRGQLLSVISVLARSDLDPWLEAVGLARMSQGQATARLCGLIAALPDGLPSGRPVDAIAGELVALLPQTDKLARPPKAASPETATLLTVMTPNGRFGLVAVALALFPAFCIAPSAATGAQAGCLAGAAVGGVAGHFAGHHALLGAAVGCAVGHHRSAEMRRTDNDRHIDQNDTH